MEISDSPIPAAILIERETGQRPRRQWCNRHVLDVKAAKHRADERSLQAWVEGLAAPAEAATS